MEYIRTYSAKGVLTALGKSLLYLLFFLAVQFLAGIVYAAIAAAGASLLPGGVDAESIMAGTETAVLLTYLQAGGGGEHHPDIPISIKIIPTPAGNIRVHPCRYVG